MKAFLIEDEPVALRNLTRLLEKHFPEIARQPRWKMPYSTWRAILRT